VDLNVLRRRRAIASENLAQACVRLGEANAVDGALLHRVQHPTSSGDVRALYLIEACLAVVEAVAPAPVVAVVEPVIAVVDDDANAVDDAPATEPDATIEDDDVLFGPDDEIPAVTEPEPVTKPAKPGKPSKRS
jgi:hypothetical protein